MERFFLIIILFGSVAGLNGCAVFKHAPRTINTNSHTKTLKRAAPKKISTDQREKLAKLAEQAIGKTCIKLKNRVFRADCSGVIRGLFAQAHIPLGGIIKLANDNDVKAIYRYVQKYGKILKEKPLPGDLIFFHNTYNRSRSGHMNDALTHIAIIEKIENNIIYFVHHLGKSIIRSRMNLSQPTISVDPKTNQRINHILRRSYFGEKSYTAAELFAGFGRL